MQKKIEDYIWNEFNTCENPDIDLDFKDDINTIKLKFAPKEIDGNIFWFIGIYIEKQKIFIVGRGCTANGKPHPNFIDAKIAAVYRCRFLLHEKGVRNDDILWKILKSYDEKTKEEKAAISDKTVQKLPFPK